MKMHIETKSTHISAANSNLLSVIGVMEPPVIVNIGPVMIEIIEPIRDRNYRASW
tara:strand:+ start:422 stop:586 length:165 start_codon:yes stop_codon:yes gene_type:complete